MVDSFASNTSERAADLLQAPWLRQSYLIGHPAELIGQYDVALGFYERVLALDPSNILAHLLQGRALLNLDREQEAPPAFLQALHLAEQELERTPESAQALIYRGDALWMLAEGIKEQQAEEALHAYGQALLLAPETPEAYQNRGWMLFALSRLKAALQDFEQLVRLRPDEPYGYHYQGCVFWDAWRYEEALQAHEQAIARDPLFVPAYLGKASTLSYMQDREEEARQVAVVARAAALSFVGSRPEAQQIADFWQREIET